jgi:hypothetical protein
VAGVQDMLQIYIPLSNYYNGLFLTENVLRDTGFEIQIENGRLLLIRDIKTPTEVFPDFRKRKCFSSWGCLVRGVVYERKV